MEYKITKKSHILAVRDSVGIITIVFLVGTIIIYYRDGLQFLSKIALFLIVGYLFLIIPALYIYFEYYLKDRNVLVSVDNKRKEIVYIKKDKEKRIYYCDIKIFEIFGETGLFYYCPSSTFSFGRLVLKSGEEIFFTRLIKYKLHDIIPDIQVINRRWLFPSIGFYKLVRSNSELAIKSN
jgi:hypothetical protein